MTTDLPNTAQHPPTRLVVVDLPFTPPLHAAQLFGHLAATAVPGVEEWLPATTMYRGALRRSLRLPGGPGVVVVHVPRPDATSVRADVTTTDPADEPLAVQLCRRLLDLDLDPSLPDTALSQDPVLAPLVAAVPGRRTPGSPSAEEVALRAVLGQQVSTAAARTHAARLAAALGEPAGSSGLRLFPSAASVAALDDDEATRLLALPVRRRETLRNLARVLAAGTLDLRHVDDGGDPERARAQLLALPGIGPWTAQTVTMRALGDTDAFLASDLGVLAAARELGLPGDARPLDRRAAAWAPWRSCAVQHLWGVLPHAINALPG
ncbi:AlkA N-terminal domain-containing protein [Streptomyces sp. NP160]|uniref:DNA-3-methyladenine glycosylase 2 n=1 Tax=Streptomyces sp. NP160 TaxID=2586637 RepID=UPI00214B4846|nr:AlkA N-terminal domain-containing protein [Streptomyces sp. NP160]